MKNENKYFFSISLKNGITITGQNPFETRDYLILIHYALANTCHTISSSTNNDTMEERYLPKLRELRKETFDAICTITQNTKKG